MFLPKSLKIFCCVFLSLQLSNVPAVAAVAVTDSMISTTAVLAELDHEKVNHFVDRADVQKALAERGVSPAEAKLRLATLSDSELNLLANHISEDKAGGILVEILIIVLIIFLIKRM